MDFLGTPGVDTLAFLGLATASFVTAFLGAIQSQTFRADGSDEIIAAARTAATPDQIDVAELKAALNGIVECDD